MSLVAIQRLEAMSSFYEFPPAELEREIAAREALLAGITSRLTGRRRLLIDVGCNRGLLMEAARRGGWTGVGVEIADGAAARARELTGMPVYGALAQIPRPDTGFDLVVAWHVLEHTVEPLSELMSAHRLMREDGLLAIQVPSFDHLSDFRARGAISSLICAVHNLYFTRRSLECLLLRAGFTPVEMSGRAGRRPRWVRTTPSWDELMLTAFARA